MTSITKAIKAWKFLSFLSFCIMAQLPAFSAWAAPFVYIPIRGSNNVTIIDSTTNVVMGSIPVGSEPVGTAANQSGSRVYVTNGQSNNVSVIDAATNKVVATIPVGMTPWGITVDPSGSRVYVTNPNSNNVSVIDTTTNTVTATIPVGSSPMGIAINPSGTMVYVANYGTSSTGPSTVMAINTATNAIVATITFESYYYAYNIAINDTGSLVYVEGNGKIWVVDAATNSIINTIQFSPGDQGGIALNPSMSKIYVTNHNSTNISVIDSITNVVTGTISVGSNPEGIAVNPEGTRIYVANYGSGSLSVIDATTNSVISTLSVGQQPGASSISIGGPATFTQPPPPPQGTTIQLTTDPTGDYEPAYSPDGNKIAFYSMRSGNPDIWVMNADGTNPTQLTFESYQDLHPHWSPDGAKIVFMSNRNGFDNVWVMNSDGTNPQMLTNFSNNLGSIYISADWSPDGTKIIFNISDVLSGTVDGNTGLWLMNSDGTGLTRLTSSEDMWPRFSPNGSKVTFGSKVDGVFQIFTMDISGGNRIQLTSLSNMQNSLHSSFSRDGQKIYYHHSNTGDGEIWVMNADGFGNTQLTSSPGIDGGPEMHPDGTKFVFRSDRSGNPDIWVYVLPTTRVTSDGLSNSGPHFNQNGSKLTFFSSKGGSNGEIYVINADRTGETRLTNDLNRDYQPHFSPDGTKIVYKSVHSGNSNIWVMNADGSGPHQVTFDTYGEDPSSPPSYGADWSPDGSKIVFDTMRSGNYDIWIMNADGTTPVQLTTSSSNEAHPHFSPDGSKIVYWSEQSGVRAIWIMDADGTNKRQVTPFATNHPHFNYNGTQLGFAHLGKTYLVNADGTGLQEFPYDANASAAVDWSPDGTKLAYMALGDIWIYSGDMTPIVPGDTIPPTGMVSINSGASTTNGTSVTLALSASDNTGTVSQMRFSNDGASWSNWEVYGTSKSWRLYGSAGTKTVYAQFRDAAGNIATVNDTILYEAAQTSTGEIPIHEGTDILVQLRPEINITLGGVSSPSCTLSSELSINAAPPTNFQLITGSSYEITSDCAFTAPITICLNYNDSAVQQSEANLKLFHHNGQNWEDITTSVDTNNNKVCGQTTSLSPFGVFEAIPPATTTKVPVQNGLWLIPSVLAGQYLLRRRKKPSA
jgi:YVTN family beta-propeller protein